MFRLYLKLYIKDNRGVTMSLLNVEQLSGGYNRKKIIEGLNFTIERGDVVGLIGLNGAGKSTTIKHILGILTPIEGTITLNDVSISKDLSEYRSRLSYIPEAPVLYDELTLKEHIEMTCMAYSIPVDIGMERAQPLLKVFRLIDKLDVLPIHFSKGMKQKVMIICAFIVEPDIYIIDEPFIGLDPLAIQDLLDLIKRERGKDRAVLMSTHILATAESYCNKFLILHEGRQVAFGTIDELRAQLNLAGYSLEAMYAHIASGVGQS